MAKRLRRLVIASVLLIGLAAFVMWMFSNLQPKQGNASARIYFRYESPMPLSTVLSDLESKGIVKSASAIGLLAKVTGSGGNLEPGSYGVSKAMNGAMILWQLRHPIHQKLRLPETNWANRTAHLLEQHHVVEASEYMALVHDPTQFAQDVSFPLPKDSLEGYLYPGTYELAPLLGAKRVIQMQLKEFEAKIWNSSERPKDLKRTLILASLVQLEAGKDVDRPMIAGVIENRIKQKMALQIDATIEYALQKWRRLRFKDYRNVKSPYNTYLTKGLPPGPICSPDAKDVSAALHPAKHNYLFYVAMPTGETIYSETYKEHLKKIKLRRAAMKAGKS